MSVLIITHSEDNDSIERVAEAISELGDEPIRFDTDLFPTEIQLAARVNGDGDDLLLRWQDGREADLSEVTAVWYRRFQAGGKLPKSLDPQLRDASRNETRRTLVGLFASLDAFWIDPFETVKHAMNKQLQLEIARELGLAIPDTLTTNDPDAVRRFAEEHPDGIVTKMLSSFAIYDDEGRENVVFTNPVGPKDLEEMEGLDLCPMTFQENVPKDVELRVTVMGRQVFAASIASQTEERATHDWRREGAKMIDRWQVHELPVDVRDRLLGLCDHLGLNYGAIDLILTPDGRYVFLEINPSGEWFWLERYPGFPLSRALAEVLVDPGRRR